MDTISNLHWASLTTGNPAVITVRWNNGAHTFEVTMSFDRIKALAGEDAPVTFDNFKAWKRSIWLTPDSSITADSVLDQLTKAVLIDYLKKVMMH